MYNDEKKMKETSRLVWGFTLLELLIVVAIISIIVGVSLFSLSKYRNRGILDSTTRKISALLREAQSRSSAQESGTMWGVHFENSTNTPAFYALFSGTYGTSTVVDRYALPSLVSYSTSSIAQGSFKEVSFAQGSGIPFLSSSITLFLSVGGTTIASSAINISGSGLIGY